jgi:hypothetical protein
MHFPAAAGRFRLVCPNLARFSVSTTPEQNEIKLIEQARRQINRLADEIAHLSETDLPPADYYGEFLKRLLQALAAPAGVIWLLTQQGNLQLQYQINMREVGLDRSEEGRESHDELLRQAITKAQPGLLPPRSGMGTAEGGSKTAAGNPTDFLLLLAPIVVDKQVVGLVEIWQDPNRGPDAQRGFLQFLVKMAGLAAGYARNHQLRQMVGAQQVWTQMEAFARQIHNSLNPTEVAYVVVNEGRRLVECDRVSVGVRHGKKAKVEAISGADIIEKRSNLVQLMRKLFDAVLIWGEKLVFTGTKDDSLPPNVLKALDEYLAESTSKLLVLLPLRDERETNTKKPPRSGILMEAFEPTASPEQMVARLEVVGKHATTALYNATEYKRIPFRFIWFPIAKLQDGLGGKAKAITLAVLVTLIVVLVAMVVVPYPLKMEAKGQIWPIERPYVFPPMPVTIMSFPEVIKPGARVAKGQEVAYLYSSDLAQEVSKLDHDIAGLKAQVVAAQAETQSNPQNSQLIIKGIELRGALIGKSALLNNMRDLYGIDTNKPGYFWLRSSIDGVVLTPDFREKLTGASVKESQPIIRFGGYNPELTRNKLSDWEVELKIQQRYVGQILAAYANKKPGEDLDVDILLASEPTRSYKGKLTRFKIAAEATPNRDDNNETEPVTLAWVRLAGKDIPADYQLPADHLVAGLDVRTRIRCGNRAMGYSLFFGVWEFLYEKVLFFF